MSNINSLTIVNQQGTNNYTVGNSYNGLKLARIFDNTISGDNVHVPHFIGYTSEDEYVFEAINAPVDITYINS